MQLIMQLALIPIKAAQADEKGACTDYPFELENEPPLLSLKVALPAQQLRRTTMPRAAAAAAAALTRSPQRDTSDIVRR
eukprot:SAG25_NODE_945_length_4647_cov_2.700528_4_plen_79_part_00